MAESIFDLGSYETIDPNEITVPPPETPVRYGATEINNELESLEGQQTQEQIIENPNLMNGIREIMKARYSEDNRNKFSFDERYDKTLSDKDTFEEWQNWMRSLSGGQTVTTGNDVAWFAGADDDQRAILGASFNIMEKMPSIFNIKKVGIRETFDGVGDYLKAGFWDPSTAIGLGVGRLFTVGSTKAAGFALKQTAKTAYKSALKRGLSKPAAKKIKKDIVTKGFKNAGITNLQLYKPLIAGTATDMALAVGTDYYYQGLRIGSGVQQERSLPQSVGAAVGVIMLPSLVATMKGAKALLSKGVEVRTGKGFKTYADISTKFGGITDKEITDEVMGRVDLDQVNSKLKNLFQDFNDNVDEYTPWLTAREEAAETVTAANIAGRPDEINDLLETTLLFGSKDDPTRGLVYSLAEAGFVYVARGEDDNLSNFIGDAIKYLPDSTVKDIVGSFSNNFGDNVIGNAGVKDIRDSADLSAWFKNRSRQAGKTLFNRKAAGDILKKPIDDITTEDLLKLHKPAKEVEEVVNDPKQRVKYIQSLWKRLLTAHPSTTGLNVRGWAYTTYLNNLADVVNGAVFGTQGSLLGAVRRGYNIMDMDATVDAGLNYIKVRPEVGEELLSEISGGVESRNVLERMGLDPDAKINKLSEASVKTIQNVMGVKLQDEVTKMVSFMSALDQNIMKIYGEDFNTFMSRPNAYSEMHTPKFLNEVQEPAIRRAKKETYSYSWLDKGDPGKNPFLATAQAVERFSNAAGGGFLIPFGRFFNTATAAIGDYSSFNALKHVVAKGFKLKNPLDDEGKLLFSKGIVGATVLFGPSAIHNGKSEVQRAEEKLKEGLAWNQERRPDGSIQDFTYDFPQAYVKIIAMGFAHLRVDGTVPSGLLEQALKLATDPLLRGTGEFYETMKGFGDVLTNEPDKTLIESVNLLAAGLVRVGQGLTRPGEPLNIAAMVATDDFSVPDRKQGMALKNELFKYVDKIPQMFGIELADLPEREVGTRSKIPFDLGGRLTGARSTPNPSPSERMAASIGIPSFFAISFNGSPELKNQLDGIVSDIFNYEAAKAIDEGYLSKSLKVRENEYAKLITKVKTIATNVFESSSKKDNKTLLLQQKVLTKTKKLKRDALDFIGYNGRIEDIKDEEGGFEKLKYLLYIIENADDIIYRD
tara:strand:- start:42 stop:3509 length:3468 start_codon:yes stop_codon:yes gene_type:complete